MRSWRAKIEAHIKKYAASLGSSRSWWPRYIYHFTDLTNAVEILKSGAIFSRQQAQNLGLMRNDNASANVINNTNTDHTRFARLYFRPRTPTQYRNEGIRPVDQRWDGAHCPVPIFFCFDALEILSRDDTFFSNGNMAKRKTKYDSSEAFFDTLDFDKIFHDGPFLPDQKNTIMNSRHCEVLVPNQLPLDPALELILCRSAAERQTLLHELPNNLRKLREPITQLGVENLFERKWSYVESVSVECEDTVVIKFNPNASTSPSTFSAELIVEERNNRRVWSSQWQYVPELRIRVPHVSAWGTVSLNLDGCLAFRGVIYFKDIPF